MSRDAIDQESLGVERSAKEALADLRGDGGSELFGINDLCKAFGVSQRTLRFYEDKGLLSPQHINGTRVYTKKDRARLVLILRAKAIGSSLAEIKLYLDLYGSHGEGRSQQLKYVLKRTDDAIAELEQKRRHIEASLAELRLINGAVREQIKNS